MNRSSRGRVQLLALLCGLTLLSIVLATAGCSGGGNEQVDAKAVLQDSVAEMQQQDTFHFTYEVKKPSTAKPAQGLEIVALEGDVTVQGEMKATIDVQQNGIPLQVNFIAVNNTHYLQFPGAPVWQKIPEDQSPLGPLNLSAGTIRILDRLQNPAYGATEDVDGVKTYRLSGMAPAADVEAIAQAVDRTEPFPAKVWIGVDDKLVHRIELDGAAVSSEPQDTVRHITLSNFNEPVDIQPPS